MDKRLKTKQKKLKENRDCSFVALAWPSGATGYPATIGFK
jgi:hypothetical protein